MKRILVGFGLALMLCLSGFSDNVFASSNELEMLSTSSSGSLLIKNGLERATFWAEGGSVTLDYMSGGQYVAWKINPYTPHNYVFTGSLEIRLASNNSLKKSVSVLASGTGSKSGTVGVHYLGLKKGTRYKAVLNGVLKDTAGTMMYVDNNVQITFTY